MLQSEFIKRFCSNSEKTEKEIFDLDLVAVPCDCKEAGCLGWAMIYRVTMKIHGELYVRNQVEEADAESSLEADPDRTPVA